MTRKVIIIFLFIWGILFLLSACKGDKKKERAVLAVVGPNKIFLDEFSQEYNQIIQTFDLSQQDGEAQSLIPRKKLLKDLIEIQMIELGAQKLGIKVSNNEFNKELEKMRKDFSGKEFKETLKRVHMSYKIWLLFLKRQFLSGKVIEWATANKIVITDEEVAAYYEENQEEFSRPRQVKLRQINVMDEDTAQAVYQRLKKGEDFETLARTYSTSPDKEKGGDMGGYFSKGELPQEFEKAVMKLRTGRISRIVKSPYGYHIFKVEDIQPQKKINLMDATSEIKEILLLEKQDKWYKDWYTGVKAAHKVEINHELLKQCAASDNI